MREREEKSDRMANKTRTVCNFCYLQRLVARALNYFATKKIKIKTEQFLIHINLRFIQVERAVTVRTPGIFETRSNSHSFFKQNHQFNSPECD